MSAVAWQNVVTLEIRSSSFEGQAPTVLGGHRRTNVSPSVPGSGAFTSAGFFTLASLAHPTRGTPLELAPTPRLRS